MNRDKIWRMVCVGTEGWARVYKGDEPDVCWWNMGKRIKQLVCGVYGLCKDSNGYHVWIVNVFVN